MPRFRKKPLEIEAIQFDGYNVIEIWGAFPDAMDGIAAIREGNKVEYLVLTTTHGDPAPCRRWDWIVPDSKPGTFYPIAPDVFKNTYDKIE